MKKTLRILVLLCLLPACGAQVKTPLDTLVIGIEAIPIAPQDPRLAMADGYSAKIASLVFNGLFRINERMEVVPDLVDSYRLTPPATYRFQIKAGIRFHNGQPLTADDIKKTIEAILDPNTASPHRGTLEKIQSIRILSPLALEIISKPFAPLTAALTFGILPGGNQVGIGTGPFQWVESSNQGIVLQRNENYFGEKAKIARLQFRIIPDENVRVMELMGGSIDFLQNNIPPPLVDYLRRRPGLSVALAEGINYSYLGMNLKQPPLNDRKVREAIARALDIPAIIAYRLADLAQPATSVLAPIHWAYARDTVQYPYSPKRARELLEEAGYPDPDGLGPKPRFALTYKTSTRKDRIGLARLIARYLKEVGIEIHILPYEWGTFFHDIQTGNFQLYSLTWVGISDPDIFYYAFHSSELPPQGANRGGYQNAAVDQLTVEARETMDRETRKGLYAQVQKILAEDLPVLSLWYEKNVAIFQKNVKGVRLRPDAGFEIFTEMSKQP